MSSNLETKSITTLRRVKPCRIEICFLSFSKNCAARNLEKGYFPFPSPKINTIYSPGLAVLGNAGGTMLPGVRLLINRTDPGWLTDSGLTLCGPSNGECLMFFKEHQRFSKLLKSTHFSVLWVGGGIQVWTGQL